MLVLIDWSSFRCIVLQPGSRKVQKLQWLLHRVYPVRMPPYGNVLDLQFDTVRARFKKYWERRDWYSIAQILLSDDKLDEIWHCLLNNETWRYRLESKADARVRKLLESYEIVA